jgi:PAS domain S-box-containing protein
MGSSPRVSAAGYAVAISILAINAVITLWNLDTIRNTWDTLVSGRDFVRGIDGVLSDLKDAETGQRGYLLTGDERYLDPYSRSHAAIIAAIDRLRSLAGDNSTRRGHLDAVAQAVDVKLVELERTIALRRQNAVEEAISIVRTDRGREAMDRLRGELAALRAEEDQSRAHLRERLQAAINRAKLTFAVASGLSLALLFAVHLLSERHREHSRRHAAWLATTLRSIGDGVIAADAHGRVTFLNPAAEALTGWKDEDAVGKPIEKVFLITDELTGQPAENPVERVLRDGTVVGLANHTTLTASDGTRRLIGDSAAPIMDEQGQLRGSSWCFAT